MKIEVTMIESDYWGDRLNCCDCPGYRALNRGYRIYYNRLPWYRKLFRKKDISWGVCEGKLGNTAMVSYKDGNVVNMVHHTEVGDKIEFISKY